MKIKLIKTGEVKNPRYKAGDWKDYVLGQANDSVSLPVQYEIEGDLVGEIKVGESIFVNRKKRNGIEIAGFFQSSPVVCFEKVMGMFENYYNIYTQNSVYKLNYI